VQYLPLLSNLDANSFAIEYLFPKDVNAAIHSYFIVRCLCGRWAIPSFVFFLSYNAYNA